MRWLDKLLPVGPRSVLWGAHCFFIHPWFVAAAWWRLYGAPRDPRLWLAFLVHDWGYWGKRNMDGPEGERHVELGARIMTTLFDWPWLPKSLWPFAAVKKWVVVNYDRGDLWWAGPWGQFCLFHSRFYAKRASQPVSRLCMADKLAIALTPAWLYLPVARLSGEL